MGTTHDNLQANLNVFLQQYRKAPHTETGDSPAKLFLGRNIRTRLDLVRPQSIATTMKEKQQAAFQPSFRSFSPGQRIYFLSGNIRMDKWIPGTVYVRLGDLHYEIVYQGKHFKRHVNQMRSFGRNDIDDSGSEGSELTPSKQPTIAHGTTSSGEAARRARFYGTMTSQNPSSSAESRATFGRVPESADSSDEQFLTPNNSPEQPRDRRLEISPPALRRSNRVRRAPLRYSP